MKSRTLLLAAIVIAAMFVMPAAAGECLGDCYDAGGTLIASGVHCWACIGVGTGVSWVCYPCPECPCPCDTSIEWHDCPDCCDGIDNDNDGNIDCDGGPDGEPRDPDCLCCLDHTECTDQDEECGTCGAVDCVPEAATIALVGIGILGIIGMGLRRREL